MVHMNLLLVQLVIYAVVKRTINGSDVYNLEQFANTSFDVPTDCTTTKTISGSYQPHGTPLVKWCYIFFNNNFNS